MKNFPPISRQAADRLLCVPILVYIVAITVLTVGCIAQPMLNDYREAAQVEAIARLLDGLPLYSEGDDAGIYLYGPAFPVLAAGGVRLLRALFAFPADAMGVAYVARGLSLLLTLIVAGAAAWSVGRSLRAGGSPRPLAPPLLAFALLWSVGYPLGQANPAPLGTLLIVAAFLFGKRGWMGVAALLTVLAFYVKAYFLAIALPLCLLSALKSRRRLAVYLAALGLFGGASWVLTRQLFPAFAVYNVVHHSNMAGTDPLHLLRQTVWLSLFYFPLFAAALWRLRCAAWRSWLTMPYLLTAALLLLVWVRLALHPGAIFGYAYQLWLPFLAVGGLTALAYFPKPAVRRGLLGWLVVSALGVGGLRFNLPTLPGRAAHTDWQALQADLGRITGGGGQVASYSPLTFPLADGNGGLLQYNNGQTEYIPTLLAGNALLSALCPGTPQLTARSLHHREEHEAQLRARRYEYVLTDQLSYVTPAFLQAAGYEKRACYTLKCGVLEVETYLYHRPG